LKKGNQRIPYYMRHKDEKLVLFAGLWDCTTLEGDKYPTYSFTIVTTSSSSQLSFIHDRMPVILDAEQDINLWLDPSTSWTSAVAKVLKPYEREVEVYPVPTEVGRVGTNDPSFVQPVSERKDGIEAMFKKQKVKMAGATPSSTQTSSSSQDTGRLTMDTSGSSSPKKEASVKSVKAELDPPETVTVGSARQAQKRALNGMNDGGGVSDVNQDTDTHHTDDEVAKEEEVEGSSPRKKVKREGPQSPSKTPKRSSPSKKKAQLPVQKGKITDFFKK